MTKTDETTSRNAGGADLEADAAGLSRRVLVRGATLGGLSLPLLAACGGGDEADTSTAEATSESAASSPSAAESSSAAPAGTTVAAADVPVGGGTILAAEKLVVTQPTKGTFKAFDSTCTHKGCPVKSIEDGEIICPCHGSHFSITDGSPISGPASGPLAAKTATAKGGQITVT